MIDRTLIIPLIALGVNLIVLLDVLQPFHWPVYDCEVRVLGCLIKFEIPEALARRLPRWLARRLGM